MMLIDERGRLLGRINLIDFLLIATVVFVILGVAARIFTPVIQQATAPMVNVTMTARVRAVLPSVAETVQATMQANAPNQLLTGNTLVGGAFVTGVEVMPHTAAVPTADGRFEWTTDPFRVDLVFTIEARIAQGPVLRIGTQEIRIGIGHFVKTTMFEFSSNIENIVIA
jgi:hypothetical protein